MINFKKLYIHGRTLIDSNNNITIYNTGSGIEFNCKCSKVIIKMHVIANQKEEGWIKLINDGDFINPIDFKVNNNTNEYIYSFDDKQKHNIKILKASEGIESYIVIEDIEIDGRYLRKPKYENEMLVLGDSTVSAFGNLGHLGEDKTLFDTDGLNGYAFLTAKYFNLPMHSVNASGWGLCFSPWTTPKRRPLLNLYDKMGPLTDELYDVKKVNPKFVVISLGTNDSFYIRDVFENNETKESKIEEFKNSYRVLLEKLKDDFGNVPVFMVYGVMKESHHFDVMHDIYLANKDEFNLNECQLLGDGLGVSGHPTIESHHEISDKLIEIVKSVL